MHTLVFSATLTLQAAAFENLLELVPLRKKALFKVDLTTQRTKNSASEGDGIKLPETLEIRRVKCVEEDKEPGQVEVETRARPQSIAARMAACCSHECTFSAAHGCSLRSTHVALLSARLHAIMCRLKLATWPELTARLIS